MAQKRMFSKKITESDDFLDMPDSCQNLYFHFSMNADDDGFVDKPKTIMRMVGAKEDSLKVLIAKNFVLPFESGVIVIKHWRINNYLRTDRYVPTDRQEIKQLVLNPDGSYEIGMANGIPMVNQVGGKRDTPDIDIDKDIDIYKERDKERESPLTKFVPPSLDEVKSYAKEKGFLPMAQKFYDYYTEGKWLDSRGVPVRNWKLKFLTWANYGTVDKTQTNFSTGREYSKEEMDSMFQKVEDIEL